MKEILNSFPRVSIIMPVRFRPDLTRVAIESVFGYTPNLELIIVQDGKDDEMKEMLSKYTFAASVYHEEAKGYTGAINAGFAKVSPDSEYVVLLNSDVVCVPGWIEKIVEAFKKNPEYGILAPLIGEADSKQSIEYSHLGGIEEAPEVKGVCVPMTREVVDKLVSHNKEFGLGEGHILDERFGTGGGDDNDICLRVKKLGYKIGAVRSSFMYHYGSAAFRELFDHDVDYSKKYAVGQYNKHRAKWKDELGEKPRIFIGLPTADGKLHIELAMRLIQWTHDPEFVVKIFPASHMFPLDNARNFIVKSFLEDYFDYLVMIDNDIIPPLETLRELIKADKDVVAPTCLTTKVDDDGLMAPIPVAHRYDSEGKYRPYYGSGVEETDVITGGMMMIKRGVLEKMDRPFYFTYHSNGTVEYSEDFVFSQQAQKLGYKLYTHFGLLCKHMKTLDIKSVNDLLLKVTSQRPSYDGPPRP